MQVMSESSPPDLPMEFNTVHWKFLLGAFFFLSFFITTRLKILRDSGIVNVHEIECTQRQVMLNLLSAVTLWKKHPALIQGSEIT